jgi:hypothetical protein
MKNLLKLLTIILILGLSSCAKSSLEYHQNLQKELTFNNALKNNEQFTLQSAKEDFKNVKKNKKEDKKDDKEAEKINQLRQKTAELRSSSN